MLKNFLKKHSHLLIISFLAIIMFFCYSFLSFHNPNFQFYTPDENANYVFVKEFSQNTKLFIDEPLNNLAQNIIHPRSVNIIDNKLVPGSFLGLILIYGFLSKIIGLSSILFATAFVSALSAIIFYFLINEIFKNKNIALFSAIFLLIIPTYWYTVSRAFFQEGLFLFLFLSGLLLLIKSLKKNNLIFFSGLLIGLSLLVRATNAVTFGFLILLFLISFRKSYKIQHFALITSALIICSAVFLYFNWQTYNNFFMTGYSYLQETTQQSSLIINLIKSLILPFGISFTNFSFNIFNYFIKYNWLICLPAIFALVFLLKNFKSFSKLIQFYIIFCLVSTFLQLLYYGNFWPWGFSGMPQTPQINLGAVHLRYWLLSTILLIPLAVYFFYKIIFQLFNKKQSLSLLIMLSIFIFINSYSLVFQDPENGLYKINQDILEYQYRLEKVQTLIPENSVIIVSEWADRVFFPKYKVIYSINDKNTHGRLIFRNISNLYNATPIYLYASLKPTDFDELNMSFYQYELELTELANIYKDEALYQLQPLQHE